MEDTHVSAQTTTRVGTANISDTIVIPTRVRTEASVGQRKVEVTDVIVHREPQEHIVN